MVLSWLIHLSLVLFFSPFILGVINKTKAFVGGRKGPPLLQAYYDLSKLFRKDMVFSRTTTWVFRAGPVVSWVSVFLGSLIVPLGHHPAPVGFSGDMILLAYLLALGRFFTASAALDTGSSFEGMGAAREVTFSALAEPALFFGFVALARVSDSLSLSQMFAGGFGKAGASWMVSFILIAVAWFIVLLAENSRIPFDDPNTHLELTMIHEVMVLDHSGPALGMILHGAAMKLFLVGALVLNLVFSWVDVDPALDWALFLGEAVLLGMVVGLVESVLARFRLKYVPNFLVAACLLSAFGVILMVR